MESTDYIEDFSSKVQDYAATKLDIWKLKAVDKTSDTLSDAVAGIVVAVFAAFGLLFLGLGLSLVIGRWTGNLSIGFFMTGGFYGCSGFILYRFRKKWLKIPVSNLLIGKLLK